MASKKCLRFSASGIGSRSRSNTFKNMIVGAAAGYLTYQAGKAIIRSMAGPMMWNNRPYYWGQNYYRPRPTDSNMCRMPLDETDPQFGNIYSTNKKTLNSQLICRTPLSYVIVRDGVTRPREIVWGCGYYEYCCGYECCRGGSAETYGGGISLGYALTLLYYISGLYV
uniref:CX domain-containing protein n=1 Tax=Heterorhabditis bacteriophora TaxID=37862 RepID=A0A1I7X4R5_HETBA